MTPEASGRPSRRRRYTRQQSETVLALTARKLRLLGFVGRYRLLSLPQAAALAGLSEKAARRHLRGLFDHGLVDVIAAPRAALADPAEPDDARLLYGSAPNLYRLTRAGLKVLQSAELAEDIRLTPDRYGPRHTLFLAHELAIRDLLIWFELAARTHPGHRLECWRAGGEALIDLQRARSPKLCHPDAWLVYRIDERALVALVEVDRGTERGGRKWGQKVAAYEELFQGGRLPDVTGYGRARILTVTPDERRRDRLAKFVGEHAPEWLAKRFWFADHTILEVPDLYQIAWRQSTVPQLQLLLAPELLPEATDPQGG